MNKKELLQIVRVLFYSVDFLGDFFEFDLRQNNSHKNQSATDVLYRLHIDVKNK